MPYIYERQQVFHFAGPMGYAILWIDKEAEFHYTGAIGDDFA